MKSVLEANPRYEFSHIANHLPIMAIGFLSDCPPFLEAEGGTEANPPFEGGASHGECNKTGLYINFFRA